MAAEKITTFYRYYNAAVAEEPGTHKAPRRFRATGLTSDHAFPADPEAYSLFLK